MHRSLSSSNDLASDRHRSRLLLAIVLGLTWGPFIPPAVADDPLFAPPLSFPTGFYPYSVAIGDLNADGKPDLGVANYESNTVSVLLGNGDGSFGTKTDFATGIGPSSVAIRDLNGDGKLDVVVANFDLGSVSVLLGNGDGTLGARTDFATDNGS